MKRAMKTMLLLGCAALAACGGGDPCDGKDGTCVAVDVQGSLQSFDTLRLDFTGAATGQLGEMLPSGVTSLPVQVAVLLPATASGSFEVHGDAISNAHTVGIGLATGSVTPGAHVRVTLAMTAVGNATCADMVRDGDETDIDCGGSCSPCAGGQVCGSAKDCKSGVCSGGKCAAGGCSDGVQNGTESDVDCGGDKCAPCGDGKNCNRASDCTNDVCTGGVCQPATCSDQVKNGKETDVDCGGGACAKCIVGKACSVGGDCREGVCSGGTCAAATCSDQVKNGKETDVDCGGGTCAACADGLGCALATDCKSGVCGNQGTCSPVACSDGIKNGAETDVDCGGGMCSTCADGKVCAIARDCTSGICSGGTCQVPSCTDSVKNGSETDVDCGGGCPPCMLGQTCLVAADCRSADCYLGVCHLAPSVMTVSPSRGRTTGGDTVTITGSNFATGATVTFGKAGKTAAAQTTFVSASSLSVRTPALPGVVGAVPVTVTNPDGQSASGSFTYALSSVSFTGLTVMADGATPSGTAAGDFNHDGYPDLVIADSGYVDATGAFAGQGVSVILNKASNDAQGHPTFAAPVVYAGGVGANFPLVADFNNDRFLDILTYDQGGTDGNNNVVPAGISLWFGNGNVVGDGTFKAAASVALPSGVSAGFGEITHGDYNGDTYEDIGFSTTMGVYTCLNKGASAPGTFNACTLGPSTGSGIGSIRSVDFNHDNYVDVAMAVPNFAANTSAVWVLMGSASGLASATPFSVPSVANEVDVVDLNGDSFADMALSIFDATRSTGAVGLLTNDKVLDPTKVSFTAAPPVPLADATFFLQHGDFNGDTWPDLLVAVLGTDVVLLNTQSTTAPSFAAPVAYYGASDFLNAIADYNKDGHLDFFGGGLTGFDGELYLGNGDGSFVDSRAYVANYNTFSLSLGDLDKDGIVDAVLSTVADGKGGPGGVELLRGDGTGGFGAPQLQPAGTRPLYVTVADLNGDGWLDAVAADAGTVGAGASSGVAVLLNDKTGKLGTAQTYGALTYANQVIVSDANGDGKPDLLLLSAGGIEWLLGDGSGRFTPQSANTAVTSATAVLANINGDAIPDLITLKGPSGQFWAGGSGGSFSAGPTFSTSAANVKQATPADLDGDGKLDLVLAYTGNTDGYNVTGGGLWVVYGDGTGGFGGAVPLPGAGLSPSSSVVVDVDGDGLLDIASSNLASSSVQIFLGQGARTFAAPLTFGNGYRPAWLGAADLDGDGRIDLALADHSALIVVGNTSQ